LKDEPEIDRIEKDVEVTFYKSRGPGGQRKNKRETAVKIVHIPTGLTARATESRSQAANRALAFERLVQKLERLKRKKKSRIPTKKPPGVKRREREKKEKQSRKKKERSRLFPGKEF
jgi:ribosome-associated protein